MTQTTIYLSVTNGKDTLTLDGNLYLFKELFTTLNNAIRELPQADSAPEPPAQNEQAVNVQV